MPDIEEIYSQVVHASQENVRRLNGKIDELDQFVADMAQAKDGIRQIPAEFQSRFAEIVTLTGKHLEDVGAATESYLASTDKMLDANLKNLVAESAKLKHEIDRLAAVNLKEMFTDLGKEFISLARNDLNNELTPFRNNTQILTDRTNDLRTEVDRLGAVDFGPMFATLQQEFITKARQDIAIELKKFENETSRLQQKINALETQVARLSEIDLEKHFNLLQSTLAALSGSVAQINLNLNTIATSLGEILTKHTSLHKTISDESAGIRKLLEDSNKALVNKLDDVSTKQTNLQKAISDSTSALESKIEHEKQVQEQRHALLVAKLSEIAEDNQKIKDGQKTDRIIIIVGIVITAIILAVILVHP